MRRGAVLLVAEAGLSDRRDATAAQALEKKRRGRWPSVGEEEASRRMFSC